MRSMVQEPLVSEALVGPFSLVEDGLCFDKIGEIVSYLKSNKRIGRFLVHGFVNEVFTVVIYEDFSWRISTTQYELFPRNSAHTIT